MICTFDQHHASRWRMIGSSATPRSRARAMRRSSSAWKRMGMVAADSPRSKPSSVMATAHPLLTPPTTSSFGQRRVGEVDLVELGLARDHLDRSHLDAGLAHVDQEEADPLVLRRVGVGAGEDEDVVGEVAGGRPDLLAVDDPLVAVEDGPAAEVAEVGPGVGLRVALAPQVLAGEDAGQVVGLLLVGPPHLQGVAEHLDAEDVVRTHRSAPRPWSSPRRGSPAPAPTAPRRRTPAASRAPGSRARRACGATRGRTAPAPPPRAGRCPASSSGGARRGRPGPSRGRPRPRPSRWVART